jgi:hypothetical protein
VLVCGLQEIVADGVNVVPEVWQVLDKIKDFSDKVRNGGWVGATGKKLTDVVAIGIGGSFLGPLFVHTALRTDQTAAEQVCCDIQHLVTPAIKLDWMIWAKAALCRNRYDLPHMLAG